MGKWGFSPRKARKPHSRARKAIGEHKGRKALGNHRQPLDMMVACGL